jgi:hypothetical protein
VAPDIVAAADCSGPCVAVGVREVLAAERCGHIELVTEVDLLCNLVRPHALRLKTRYRSRYSKAFFKEVDKVTHIEAHRPSFLISLRLLFFLGLLVVGPGQILNLLYFLHKGGSLTLCIGVEGNLREVDGERISRIRTTCEFQRGYAYA